MLRVLPALILVLFAESVALADPPNLQPPVSHGESSLWISKPGSSSSLHPAYRLNESALYESLANVPRESLDGRDVPGAILLLPSPTGSRTAFEVWESPVAAPELSEWLSDRGFPMKTYVARSPPESGGTIIGRFSVGGPMGLSGFFRDATLNSWTLRQGSPHDETDALYVSTQSDDAASASSLAAPEPCSAPTVEAGAMLGHLDGSRGSPVRPVATLRTLRLAVSASGEFSQYHGGTVVNAQAAIVDLVNIMNVVFETDLAVRFILVANNDLLASTSPGGDPFTVPDSTAMTAENRVFVDATLGPAAYDLALVLAAGANAMRSGAIGNACQEGTGGSASPHKAEGVAMGLNPLGAEFALGRMAHVVGHQLGASHTWNACIAGSFHGLSVEPGAGTTIMGYPEACSALNDLGSLTAPQFHSMNIAEMDAYIATTATCAAPLVTSNANAPVVDAGAGGFVPVRTPFRLTPRSTYDADGDSLTYSWEQIDSGVFGSQVSASAAPGSTSGPLFRVAPAAASPTRTFPPEDALVAGGTPPLGERLPQAARTLTFQMLVRDNGAGGGLVATDTTEVAIFDGDAGNAFAVVSPAAGASLPPGASTVTWSVAATDQPPFYCGEVDITLSLNGGISFDHPLATGVANTGSASVLLPDIACAEARVRITPVGGIFFAQSAGDFTITGSSAAPFFFVASTSIDDSTPIVANGNGLIEPDEEQIAITPTLSNAGTAASAAGATAVLSSLTPTVVVTDPGPVTLPAIAIDESAATVTPFVISVDPSHPCSAPVLLRLTVTSGLSTQEVDFSLPTGDPIPATLLPTESFEGGSPPAGWSISTALGLASWWIGNPVPQGATAQSGSGVAMFAAPTSDATLSRLITPEVLGATRLSFYHSFDGEDDGGSGAHDAYRIEITTDGGASWDALPASSFLAGAYTHLSVAASGSPLTANTPCWSGQSPAFPAMQFVDIDLSAYRDAPIRVAFSYAEDECCSESHAGWFIDDVTIDGVVYTCAPAPVELSAFALD